MKFATTKERIMKFLDYKEISVSAFLQETGIKRGFLDKDKLNSTVSDVFIATIIATYPDLNLSWLITGKGEMIKSKEAGPLLKNEQTSEVCAATSDEGIPLIPLDAIAGFGTENSSQVMEYECEKYVVPDFRGANFLIQVKGSSMYPKYASGDIVACKKLPLDTFFQWNKVYVIDSEQGVLIKRVKPGKDADHIMLISENERYDPFELHRQNILSLAIVMGVIRLE